MKITGYRSLTTVQHWGHPVGDVNGTVPDGVTQVPILLVDTDDGITGVGLGPHPGIEMVFPAVEGEDPRAVTALYDRMLAHVFKTGHTGADFGAIGVLDLALWDLKAKAADEPLWRTLGARDRFIPGYASCLEPTVPLDDLPALWTPWVERGFSAVKVKGGLDLDSDVERLTLARDIFGAAHRRPAVMFDVNESWSRSQAVRQIGEIERHLDLTWIEEPVRRWDAEGLAFVARGVRAGVASGENLTGLEQFRPMLDAGGVSVVQTGSCWGITHFLRVSTLAHARDLPVSPVGSHCDPLAPAAAAVPNHLTCEIQSLRQPQGISVAHEYAEGGIWLGDAPGNGYSVNEAAAIAHAQNTGQWSVPSGPHVRPADAGLRLRAVPSNRQPDHSKRPNHT